MFLELDASASLVEQQGYVSPRCADTYFLDKEMAPIASRDRTLNTWRCRQ